MTTESPAVAPAVPPGSPRPCAPRAGGTLVGLAVYLALLVVHLMKFRTVSHAVPSICTWAGRHPGYCFTWELTAINLPARLIADHVPTLRDGGLVPQRIRFHREHPHPRPGPIQAPSRLGSQGVDRRRRARQRDCGGNHRRRRRMPHSATSLACVRTPRSVFEPTRPARPTSRPPLPTSLNGSDRDNDVDHTGRGAPRRSCPPRLCVPNRSCSAASAASEHDAGRRPLPMGS
jgi:hypothetical protein